MKKFLTVLVALVLMIVIAGGAVYAWLGDKYKYSTETADMEEYFGVSLGECAIILQDEMIESKALVEEDICYLALEDVHKYLSDVFYVDTREQLLLYTDGEGTTRVSIGTKTVSKNGDIEELPYTICFVRGETCYIALDYVRRFANFEYRWFGDHMQMYTQWGEATVATVNKKTQVRVKGGIKSPILAQLEKGEQVEILERMETWCKVKTVDGIIGYTENKRLSEEKTVTETPVTDFVEKTYADNRLSGKVCLGWHAIGGTGGNVTLDEMVAGTKGMNVIAPTWFSLIDDEGQFRSFGEASYVDKAHSMGLKVWGVFDDFNYRNETKTVIDDYEILSSTTLRTGLVERIVDTSRELGLDGVNIDFEKLTSDCGPHFAQFIRELGVACDQANLILSVDNYMPNEGNKFYRTDVQGKAADYVILMGYDEHWHGSSEPGSVASIPFVTEGIEKTLNRVPADKLINGIPFYTIVWTIDGTEVSDEYLTMNNLADYLLNHPYEYAWDETTCQNYMEWQSGTKTYKIWIEDAESIQVKLNVMNAHNLAGVAVWRLGYGTPAAWDLINIYVQTP